MKIIILKSINASSAGGFIMIVDYFFELIERVPIIKLVKEKFLNTYSVLMHLALKEYPFVGILRENREAVTITDFRTLALYITGMKDVTNHLEDDYIEFTYLGKKVKIQGANKNGDLGASFLEYNFLDVGGKTVIDIGASIADSSIYFCLKNAEKVIALEPFQYLYNLALQNIILNELSDKIILLNAGYGTDGIITIDNRTTHIGGQIRPDLTDRFQNNYRSKITTYSLKSLINTYCVNNDNLLLKMDCEGCEYNLLNEDDEILAKFERIQIEYHYGYSELEKKLEDAGFVVSHTHPKKGYFPDYSPPKLMVGYLFAKRKNQP
jgi:FkbM family methyltransferase